MSNYAGFNLAKLRFYVSTLDTATGDCNAVFHLYIYEKSTHYLQVKHRVSAPFKCQIKNNSDFWFKDEMDANVRAWCVKQATKLGLFEKLKDAVYGHHRRNPIK